MERTSNSSHFAAVPIGAVDLLLSEANANALSQVAPRLASLREYKGADPTNHNMFSSKHNKFNLNRVVRV
jgi:hypothetical protein